MRILHLLDSTTTPEAVETLALVLRADTGGDHRVAVLGHFSTVDLLVAAGVSRDRVTFFHSMGWLDITGWRSVRQLVKEIDPTHLHAWGVPAAVVGSTIWFKGERVVTLTDMPSPMQLRLLPMIHKGGLTGIWPSASPCRWIVSTQWLKRELHSHGIAADAVTLVRTPLPVPRVRHSPAAVREYFGLKSGDWPVVLLGGEGGSTSVISPTPAMNICLDMANGAKGKESVHTQARDGRGGPRHDLGLWSAAIVQQIFPRICVIVREDARGRVNPGLERLFGNLPDETVTLVAPREFSWDDLLAISDVMLVTPDGPFAGGSILHAIAARVPVVGTSVESVLAYVTDGQTAVLSPSHHPRTIAAAIERFFGEEPEMRQRMTERAQHEAHLRHDPTAAVRAYLGHYVGAEAMGVMGVSVAVGN